MTFAERERENYFRQKIWAGSFLAVDKFDISSDYSLSDWNLEAVNFWLVIYSLLYIFYEIDWECILKFERELILIIVLDFFHFLNIANDLRQNILKLVK